MKKKSLSDRGFTLIELMVGFVCGAILMGMVGLFFVGFHQNQEASKVMMALQEQVEYALDLIIHGQIRGKDIPTQNPRLRGVIWADHYEFDPNNKFISASEVDPVDPNKPGSQNSHKKIFFPDYDLSNSQSDPNYIGYVQRGYKLYQTVRKSSGIKREETVVIPYLDGTKEYKKEAYQIEAQFQPYLDANLPQEIQKSLLKITICAQKDGLSFSLDSMVKLRNKAPNT